MWLTLGALGYDDPPGLGLSEYNVKLFWQCKAERLGLLVLFIQISRYKVQVTTLKKYTTALNTSFISVGFLKGNKLQAYILQPITFMMNQNPKVEFKKHKTLDIDLVKANPFFKEEKPSCISYTSKFE